jgi:hypothetical protein
MEITGGLIPLQGFDHGPFLPNGPENPVEYWQGFAGKANGGHVQGSKSSR